MSAEKFSHDEARTLLAEIFTALPTCTSTTASCT